MNQGNPHVQFVISPFRSVHAAKPGTRCLLSFYNFLTSGVSSSFSLPSSGHAGGGGGVQRTKLPTLEFVLLLSLWSRRQPWGAVPAYPHHSDSPLPDLRPCGDELPPGPVPACHPSGRPASTHHSDEARPGLWLQGGIRGKRLACENLER